MRIIETDNFGRDYPNERFIAVNIESQEMAETMAEALVAKYSMHPSADRYYRVVPDDYKLSPGFEP
jgi:hypothetical protein